MPTNHHTDIEALVLNPRTPKDVLERFGSETESGYWQRVSRFNIKYWHLAYWDDIERTWRAVPGREQELCQFLREHRREEYTDAYPC